MFLINGVSRHLSLANIFLPFLALDFILAVIDIYPQGDKGHPVGGRHKGRHLRPLGAAAGG